MNPFKPHSALDLGANGIIGATDQFAEFANEHPWKHECRIPLGVRACQAPPRALRKPLSFKDLR